MKYLFADLVIDIRYHYDFGERMSTQYLYTGDRESDYTVEVSEEVVTRALKEQNYEFSPGNVEFIEVYREICKLLCPEGFMFMHCSALSYKGNGVLFTAPSGTGKSTHSSLWRKHFGEDVVMVNDDKPLLHFVGKEIFVCGTPWDGKHKRSTNISVPVKAIVILSQAPTNAVQKATKQEALYHILNQTIRAMSKELMTQVLDMVEQLLAQVPVYKLGCTISDEAVTTIFDEIKENFDEN